MKKVVTAISISAAAFGLGGCATVINGTSQDIQFQSEPEGAVVAISTGASCETPCEVSLKRRNDLRVDFEKEGYKPAFIYVQSRTGGAMAGNILAGGLIGGIVDGSNGATNSLYPRPVYVRLAALGSDEEPMLLDKDGVIISTVAEHNEKVGADVEEGLAKQAEKAAKKAAKKEAKD